MLMLQAGLMLVLMATIVINVSFIVDKTRQLRTPPATSGESTSSCCIWQGPPASGNIMDILWMSVKEYKMLMVKDCGGEDVCIL